MCCSFQALFQLSRTTQALISLCHLLQCIGTSIYYGRMQGERQIKSLIWTNCTNDVEEGKIHPCIVLSTGGPRALSELLHSSAKWGGEEGNTQISSIFLPPGLRLIMSFLISSYRNMRREYGKAQNHQVGLFGRGDSENTGSRDALCIAELWLDGIGKLARPSLPMRQLPQGCGSAKNPPSQELPPSFLLQWINPTFGY